MTLIAGWRAALDAFPPAPWPSRPRHWLCELALDECFCIPVAAVPRPIAYRKAVRNFDWSADGSIRAERMALERA